eukprot:gnl/TRDRNA2_/TRDRNA2_69367_c0_seq1.p1 gnl/TRDRNA2_/TRDRNA2_69367_c0~~gnl/TRDRNA2_/TRDRNA2_69367_c0_seq1.p1  ORF type:complete len:290 (-),score=59.15 gnl/TRDRNA2_/TRDRNA2_69367_c0_seq1:171-1040(-)
MISVSSSAVPGRGTSVFSQACPLLTSKTRLCNTLNQHQQQVLANQNDHEQFMATAKARLNGIDDLVHQFYFQNSLKHDVSKETSELRCLVTSLIRLSEINALAAKTNADAHATTVSTLEKELSSARADREESAKMARELHDQHERDVEQLHIAEKQRMQQRHQFSIAMGKLRQGLHAQHDKAVKELHEGHDKEKKELREVHDKEQKELHEVHGKEKKELCEGHDKKVNRILAAAGCIILVQACAITSFFAQSMILKDLFEKAKEMFRTPVVKAGLFAAMREHFKQSWFG